MPRLGGRIILITMLALLLAPAALAAPSGRDLYNEVVAIPMIVKFPSGLGGGRVVDGLARQVDVMPTVLEAIGRGPLPGLEGRSLLADALGRGGPPAPVTAFAHSFGEGGDGTLHYYLASAADEIWLQPSGDLDLTGFQLESPFLKALLERIGVEPQIDQREDYKGAMNALTDSALPAPIAARMLARHQAEKCHQLSR